MIYIALYIIIVLCLSKMFTTTSDGEGGFRYDREDWYYGLNILNFMVSAFITMTIYAIFM